MNSTKKYKIAPVKLKKHVHQMISINEQMLNEHYPIEYWTIVISQHHSFVLLDKDTVIGYCLAGTLDERKIKEKQSCIISFALLSKYHGLKLSRKLLQSSCNSLKKMYNKVSLNVRSSNTIAQNLYITEGFIESKIIPNYYPEEDGILMIKQL